MTGSRTSGALVALIVLTAAGDAREQQASSPPHAYYARGLELWRGGNPSEAFRYS